LLDYKTIGKGEAIFLIHGFCEDHTIWDNIVNALQDKYKFIVPDLPGFGNSSINSNVKSIADWAVLLKAIFNQEKINHAIMIGHSMGGYVSLAFAKKYPQLLTGLGLFHSTAFADNDEKILMRKRSIDFLEKNTTDGFVKELIPKLFGKQFKQSHPNIIEDFKTKALQYSNSTLIFSTNAMMHREDSIQLLENIEIPVLFIIGEKDETYSLNQSLQQTYLGRISQICILKNVGHMGMIEAPDESIKIVKEFIELCSIESEG